MQRDLHASMTQRKGGWRGVRGGREGPPKCNGNTRPQRTVILFNMHYMHSPWEVNLPSSLPHSTTCACMHAFSSLRATGGGEGPPRTPRPPTVLSCFFLPCTHPVGSRLALILAALAAFERTMPLCQCNISIMQSQLISQRHLLTENKPHAPPAISHHSIIHTFFTHFLYFREFQRKLRAHSIIINNHPKLSAAFLRSKTAKGRGKETHFAVGRTHARTDGRT